MINHEFLATAGKGIAVLTAGALGFAGCNYVMGDANPHPLGGRVDQLSQPEWECHYSPATKTNSDCDYHYYLFVNGCVELPAEVQAYIDSKEPDRSPEYGWVEVSSETWSQQKQGDYITFSERGFMARLFADQDDDNHPCPIPTK